MKKKRRVCLTERPRRSTSNQHVRYQEADISAESEDEKFVRSSKRLRGKEIPQPASSSSGEFNDQRVDETTWMQARVFILIDEENEIIKKEADDEKPLRKKRVRVSEESTEMSARGSPRRAIRYP